MDLVWTLFGFASKSHIVDFMSLFIYYRFKTSIKDMFICLNLKDNIVKKLIWKKVRESKKKNVSYKSLKFY